MSNQKRTWSERHENEVLSDNSGMYAQCKTCAQRIFLMIRGKEVGYKKPFCAAYPEQKPECVWKTWKASPCPDYKEEREIQD